jgi:hypothetical protein
MRAAASSRAILDTTLGAPQKSQLANPLPTQTQRALERSTPYFSGARPSAKEFFFLFLITAAAILVHGYHPYVEDAEIYAPGIKKLLHPGLYPHNAGFFTSHASMTMFPRLIADSIRMTHLPFDWALFLWQFFSIFLLLVGCWHLAGLCFPSKRARWGGVVLVASLLTIPVAGTALYIMDQYLTSRALSTPAIVFLIVNTVERKFLRAGLWTIFIALIHPLMAVFGIFFCAVILWQAGKTSAKPFGAALLFPFSLFPPLTEAYKLSLNRHSYFFVTRWEWYEWVGIFAPLLLLWWFSRIARSCNWRALDLICRALIPFQLFFFAVSLVLCLPVFANFAELQTMRSLHLLYVLLFIFAGGLLAEFVLKVSLWRWLALFVPLCAGMFYAQLQLFPGTAHIEFPGAASRNAWVDAFLWIRHNTPEDAYFVLDPNYMKAGREDVHGFRCISERSSLADDVKDSGAVSMFPALAEKWQQQSRALQGWQNFRPADFEKLHQQFGVDWALLDQPGSSASSGFTCPYRDGSLQVCRIQ